MKELKMNLPYAPAVVRIELIGNEFSIEKLNPESFTIYGFGSFLETIKRGYVSINQDAYDFMSKCLERRGLMAIEIFDGPILAYGSRAPLLVGFGKEDVSVNKDGWAKLSKLVTIEK